MLRSYRRLLSANLVIGNAAYGLKPRRQTLDHAGNTLASCLLSCRAGDLKLGAEGVSNGKKAVELASRTNSVAYILHTPAAAQLISYARSKNVQYVIYTLCRIAETESRASCELLRIKGTSYFERRGVLRDNISTSTAEFSIFGSGDRIVQKIRQFIDHYGASKVVLYPVFESYKDLIGQLKLLSTCLN